MRNAAAEIESQAALESIDEAKAIHGFHFDTCHWAQSFLDILSTSSDDEVRWGSYFRHSSGLCG